MLTPEQVAQRAGVSRPTVSRALKEGELRGIRDNRSRWRITPEDADAWAMNRLNSGRNSVHAGPEQRHERIGERPAQLAAPVEQGLLVELADLRVKVERAEAQAKIAEVRVEAAEARAAELVIERDWLRDRFEEITRPTPPVAAPRRGFLARLLGVGAPG
jgi:excisionase family DNA binding protein